MGAFLGGGAAVGGGGAGIARCSRFSLTRVSSLQFAKALVAPGLVGGHIILGRFVKSEPAQQGARCLNPKR